MTIILQSYATLKKQTSPEFARQVLLENLKRNNGNVEKTAKEMICSKNTVYLAISKQRENDLGDKPHTPKTAHPRTTAEGIIDLIVRRRKETGFGKRRLKWYIAGVDGILIPESTIGKIFKSKKLSRQKKRVRREYHRVKYHWESLLPFDQMEMDTKEILDKGTLPEGTYQYVKESYFIPKYQWTIIDVLTRMRFLAWSYSLDWSCGRVFGKVVIWWLRLFGFRNEITIWTDGGVEFNSARSEAFQRTCKEFWEPLGVKRKIIRKGHPEDNPFVERSHQTDDYEFYIPHLLRVKSEVDFIRLGAWWIKVGNLIRPNMNLGDMTPYQKLRSLGYVTAQEFCLFPSLILDRLVALPQILNAPKTVQDHFDYDHFSRFCIKKHFLCQ